MVNGCVWDGYIKKYDLYFFINKFALRKKNSVVKIRNQRHFER